MHSIVVEGAHAASRSPAVGPPPSAYGCHLPVPGRILWNHAFSSVHCSGCWFSRAKSITCVTLVSATS
jgi:hypothetical protein